MTKFLSKVRKDESGATAIEYALLAALVGGVIIGALAVLGDDISNIFGSVSTALKNPGSAS